MVRRVCSGGLFVVVRMNAVGLLARNGASSTPNPILSVGLIQILFRDPSQRVNVINLIEREREKKSIIKREREKGI